MKKRTKRILMVVCSLIAILSSVLYMNVCATDDADKPALIATQEETTEMSYEDAQEFIDSYADNVGAEDFDAETFKSDLNSAITAVRKETTPAFATIWGLLPPVIAILLALITKEVYSSLFIGILSGIFIYSRFNPVKTVTGTFDQLISSLTDSWNMGILIFLILLGIIVCLMNKAGGSAAYGEWATKRIKSRKGAMLATFGLGVLIFVDDYFNCLTVGSVMRPVTDKYKVSRSKLAYLIDATAAPVCIIAPISSWAAAVTSVAPEGQGLTLFIKTIPYNLYALLTLGMIIFITLLNIDFGAMKKHEIKAIEEGDLFYGVNDYEGASQEKVVGKGKVIDLILPVIVLIVACIFGMVYTGGFFHGVNFIQAFADSDASVGLVYGAFAALIFTLLLYLPRGVLKFKDTMDAIPEGFKAMVPAMLILAFAWTLGGTTGLLGAKIFVAEFVRTAGASLQYFLPAIVFLVAIGLSFATGTSWGTFGILLPIVCAIFPSGELQVISVSACLVCGDHCSPISDTTIMASAGAQSNHVNHVYTQLPYALYVAFIAFIGYIIAGFIKNPIIVLVISFVLLFAGLMLIKTLTNKGTAKAVAKKADETK
jgi:Na+/H+ antiporter NhaC